VKRVAFHPAAESEFAKDFEFYAERSCGLAEEFADGTVAPHRRRTGYWHKRN
jgi:hypothetical protein